MQLNRSKQTAFALVTGLLTLFATVPVSGQERTVWRTARDIQAGRNGAIVGTVDGVDTVRLMMTVRPDGDTAPVRVTTDAGTTRYRGFGDGSANDVYRGERGFMRVKRGDRVDITGVGSTAAAMAASDVRLLGRSTTTTPATPTTTTPTTTRTTPPQPAARADQIDGTVRSVAAADNRFVIESADRRFYTIRGTVDTPVTFRGQTYRIRNLEVGDVVRVDTDRRTYDEIRPRSIAVLRSVSDTPATTPSERTIASVAGRISRVDPRDERIRVEPESGREVIVDIGDADDEGGRTYRPSEARVGDWVIVSGRYDAAGVLRADTVRRSTRDAVLRDDDDDEEDRIFDREDDEDDEERDEEEFDDEEDDRFSSIVLSGRIVDSLSSADYLTIRLDDANRDVQVLVDDELIARTRTGSYITANQLRIGESVTIRAYRHNRGTYIAQTIRVR